MTKVIVWCPGLHTTSPADSAQVMRELVTQQGWNFLFISWPKHSPNQADEGFTFWDGARAVIAEVHRHHAAGRKVVLAGTSFGGWVAAYVACILKDEVSGLLLANPTFNFVGNYLRTKLPWGLRHVMWFWYGCVRPFRYYIEKTGKNYFMPMSFVRDCGMNGYDVVKLASALYCPVLAVTAPASQESFLATPDLAAQFCAKVRGPVTLIKDDGSFGHISRTVVSDKVREALRATLNAM